MSLRIIKKSVERGEKQQKLIQKQLANLRGKERDALQPFVGSMETVGNPNIDYDLLQDILHGEIVLGQRIVQNWLEDDTLQRATYQGVLKKIRQWRRTAHFEICYWKQGETEEEQGEDCLVKFEQLALDYIDDVFFVWFICMSCVIFYLL